MGLSLNSQEVQQNLALLPVAANVSMVLPLVFKLLGALAVALAHGHEHPWSLSRKTPM